MTSAGHTALPLIAALGAGRMGRGIAHAFAYAGYPVVVVDLKARTAADLARLEREFFAEVDASLASLAALGAFDDAERPVILERIRFAGRGDAPAALRDARFVFEGVPEVVAAKRDAFQFACAYLPADAVVTSTTSTIMATTLAEMVPRPERFLNGHWLNPAYLIPLVEVSPHAGTAPAVVDALVALVEGLGKKAVKCKPSPGYIVPRFQSLIMNEAARMVAEGVASPEDIDAAVRFGLGFRYANMGVIEFIDYGGLDITYYAGNYLAEALDPRFRPPEAIAQMMQAGQRGLREGRGYYDWTGVDIPAYRRATLAKLFDMLRYSGLHRPPHSALGGG